MEREERNDRGAMCDWLGIECACGGLRGREWSR
jgi:hypothetical protein